jgi:hypothetical protein
MISVLPVNPGERGCPDKPRQSDPKRRRGPSSRCRTRRPGPLEISSRLPGVKGMSFGRFALSLTVIVVVEHSRALPGSAHY